MTKPSLTAARLRELLTYDSETGIFTRLVRTNSNAKTGVVRGTASDGYLRIMVDGIHYRCHRLAWFYVHGVWPTADIDHINGQRADNRLCNLREATRSENNQNQRRARSDNQSGFLGVGCYKRTGRWRAHININGKEHHLGYFSTPELAHAAYLRAKAAYHPFNTLPYP